MSTTTDSLIDLRNLHFSYRDGAPVLQGLHLRVGRSERIALTGRTGSGKTTLLHIMVGLLRPRQGDVHMFGSIRRNEQDFRSVRHRAGLLFQDPDDQLFCPTVLEDVAFGPLNLGMSRREAVAAACNNLNSLGIADCAQRITHHLSGGEKRLVTLAAVLAMDPELLLLDEPTTGLDSEASARLADVLAALPHAMIVVSHDTDFLDRTTGRRLCLQGGQIR